MKKGKKANVSFGIALFDNMEIHHKHYCTMTWSFSRETIAKQDILLKILKLQNYILVFLKDYTNTGSQFFKHKNWINITYSVNNNSKALQLSILPREGKHQCLIFLFYPSLSHTLYPNHNFPCSTPSSHSLKLLSSSLPDTFLLHFPYEKEEQASQGYTLNMA